MYHQSAVTRILLDYAGFQWRSIQHVAEKVTRDISLWVFCCRVYLRRPLGAGEQNQI